MVPALAAAAIWLPIAILAYDGLGLVVPAVACITSTMLVTTLPALGASPTPLSARASRSNRGLGLAAAAVVALLVGVSAMVPVFSAEAPQRVNIVFRQDGAAQPARVYVEAAWATMPWGKPPAAMVRALGEPSRVHSDAVLLPGAPPVPFAEVPRVAMEGPTVEVLTRSRGMLGEAVRARLTSSRGARTIVVKLPLGVRVNVEGQTALPRNGLLVLRAVPAEGIVLDFEVDGSGREMLTLLDVTPGLPPASEAPIAHDVLGARGSLAVPTQEGDITLVGRRIEL